MNTYQVARRAQDTPLTVEWNGEAWRNCEELELKHHMGDRPTHFPTVSAKLTYDDRSLDVLFQVADRYVVAQATDHQQMVCNDSCVEFFFTPGTAISQGYFNLEMNCGGVMLFHYQREPRRDSKPLPRDMLQRIEVLHSMPVRIPSEIKTPTIWHVAYRIPLRELSAFYPGDFCFPVAGAKWRANFYKCADKSSHPHWLTWSPVEKPHPDFHVPIQFGILEFA